MSLKARDLFMAGATIALVGFVLMVVTLVDDIVDFGWWSLPSGVSALVITSGVLVACAAAARSPRTRVESTRSVSAWMRAGRSAMSGGVAIIITSLVVIVGIAIDHGGSDVSWWALSFDLSLVFIIVGVLVTGFAVLAVKGRSIEEAYRMGFDVGYEAGFHAEQERIDNAAETAIAKIASMKDRPPRQQRRRLGGD